MSRDTKSPVTKSPVTKSPDTKRPGTAPTWTSGVASGGVGRRRERLLHPVAWWLWAVGVAAAVSRTTNPLVLLLLLGAILNVVAARRVPGPWGRSLSMLLRLAVVVVGIRVVVQVLLGVRLPGTVLVELPSVTLPEWMAGVELGGPITLEALLGAVYQGLRLAVLMAVFGAVNSLTSPRRLMRCLPAVLYEAGVVVGAALSFTPETVTAVSRIRTARRLRGRPTRGVAGLRGVLVPVLEWSLERSVFLAASMDARGYGRRGVDPTGHGRRFRSDIAVLAGLLGVGIGAYGVLDGSAPAALGVPMLAVGAGLCVLGLLSARSRVHRTRHRPEPWLIAEWAVVGAGVACAAAMLLLARVDPAALAPSTQPLEMPRLPMLALFAMLAAIAPAWLAPPVPAASVPTLLGSGPSAAPGSHSASSSLGTVRGGTS